MSGVCQITLLIWRKFFKWERFSMLKFRKSKERGETNHGWLHSFHSFGNYFDQNHMSWGNLRVINDDRIAPGRGFDTHEHRDMEIISYVLAGNLAHKDSMGNVEGIPPGDVQRMSAGSGVRHSEFNHAANQETHFLQIWITPSVTGIASSYEQKSVPQESKRGHLVCIASPAGGINTVKIHADATLYAGLFDGDESAVLPINTRRKAYVHLVRGKLNVNGHALETGDAAMMEDESKLMLDKAQDAEVLVFDLAS